VSLCGWQVDLRAIYRGLLRRREEFGLGERLYESPGAACAVLFFGIGEVGLNKQVAGVVLLRGKEAPRLAYHSGRMRFWYEGQVGEPVVFVDEGRRARLHEFVQRFWRRELGIRDRILDCEGGRLLPI
jgi:hypothetical protein